MVAGHPLKGGMWPMSKGMLLNPEIKRFALFSPLFFKPVRPGAGAGDSPAENNFASSDSLVEAYTGSSTTQGSERCQAFRQNLDNCVTNNSSNGRDPEVHCQYYVQSLKREMCSA